MPLYLYKCSKCKSLEELLQKHSDPEKHLCPYCNEPNGMKRTIAQASVSFAGSGWYKDGYQNKKN